MTVMTIFKKKQKTYKPCPMTNDHVFVSDTELNPFFVPPPAVKQKPIEDDIEIFIPSNCKNCGAPVNQELCKCEYCGTYYGATKEKPKYFPDDPFFAVSPAPIPLEKERW